MPQTSSSANTTMDFSRGIAMVSQMTRNDAAISSLPSVHTVTPSEAMIDTRLPQLLESISGGPSVNDQTFSALKPPLSTPALLLPQNSRMVEQSIREDWPSIAQQLPAQSAPVGDAVLEFINNRDKNQQLLSEYHDAIISA